MYINKSREFIDSELSSLVGESYNRAYDDLILAQQMTELEEIIEINTCNDANKQKFIKSKWNNRLINGCKNDVKYWSELLLNRTLAIPMKNDIEIWLKFSSLALNSTNNISLSNDTIMNLNEKPKD